MFTLHKYGSDFSMDHHQIYVFVCHLQLTYTTIVEHTNIPCGLMTTWHAKATIIIENKLKNIIFM